MYYILCSRSYFLVHLLYISSFYYFIVEVVSFDVKRKKIVFSHCVYLFFSFFSLLAFSFIGKCVQKKFVIFFLYAFHFNYVLIETINLLGNFLSCMCCMVTWYSYNFLCIDFHIGIDKNIIDVIFAAIKLFNLDISLFLLV